MLSKPATPSGGSRAASSSLSSQVITLHAKSQQALMSATARQVAALQETPNSETVLVVYSDNAARVFCEQNASQPKAHLQR